MSKTTKIVIIIKAEDTLFGSRSGHQQKPRTQIHKNKKKQIPRKAKYHEKW